VYPTEVAPVFSRKAKKINKVAIRLKRSCRHLARNEDGVVAIEFAMVGLPFLMLSFAILELGLVFMADVNLTHATSDSARKVRTHQAGIDTVDKFIEDVCDTIIFIPSCKSKLKAEVKVYDDFESISRDSPLNESGNLKDTYIFNKGGPGSVITVRTFYEWDMFVSLPDIGLGNMTNGNRLMEGFAAFRNE
jgi:Flp pilus assembly protein TadG